jgi:LmbE family N-acetylglucosaminyl deacetylase
MTKRDDVDDRSLREVTGDGWDVLAVGAHPDDLEIGCGGTLAKLVAMGHRVGMVDLTDGEPTPGCASPEIRVAEAHQAARVLGVQERKILPLPNRRLFDSFEARVLLAKEIRRHRPSLVIGLGSRTPMASPDHQQAVSILDAAVFYARLSKWDSYFDNLPTHSVTAQLYYQLVFDPAASGASDYRIVHDISGHLEQKMEAIACYQTQFPPEKRSIFDRVRALAASHGLCAGVEAAEVLWSVKPVVTRDLMRACMVPS